MKIINLRTARVSAVYRDRYSLIDPDGSERSARLKTSVFLRGGASLPPAAFSPAAFPTVGDFVDYAPNDFGDSLICAVRPRRTFFSRLDPTPGRGEQAVAANFDVVFAATSLNRDFNIRKLERYVSLSGKSGAETVVLLTKSDLCADASEYVAAAERAAAGHRVVTVSAATGHNIDLVAGLIGSGTAVFLGSSGVGKSSVINALAGREVMSTGAIRESDSRGRHTTTNRQLIPLPSGAFVIDTPGMRALGMWDAESGVADAFPDVTPFIGHCRFSDCSHTSEPGCAVRAAIESGELSPERWESYSYLSREARRGKRK